MSSANASPSPSTTRAANAASLTEARSIGQSPPDRAPEIADRASDLVGREHESADERRGHHEHGQVGEPAVEQEHDRHHGGDPDIHALGPAAEQPADVLADALTLTRGE